MAKTVERVKFNKPRIPKVLNVATSCGSDV